MLRPYGTEGTRLVPEILLITARWLAIGLLVMSVLLMLLRWRYPQKQDASVGTLAQWREVWRLFRASRSREKQRDHDIAAVRRKNVLVVDPDEKSARVLVWRLEGLGCRVARTRNGTMGLQAANSQSFDVIIADALLSDVSAIDFYRALSRDTPIVYVGVVEAQRHELKALGEGVACLRKPFDPERAVELAGRLLRKRDLNPAISSEERQQGI